MRSCARSARYLRAIAPAATRMTVSRAEERPPPSPTPPAGERDPPPPPRPKPQPRERQTGDRARAAPLRVAPFADKDPRGPQKPPPPAQDPAHQTRPFRSRRERAGRFVAVF